MAEKLGINYGLYRVSEDRTNVKPSIEMFYGPWESITDAKNTIKNTLGITDDLIPEGLTIAIKEADNKPIVEYWWSAGAFVVKTNGGGGSIDYDVKPYVLTLDNDVVIIDKDTTSFDELSKCKASLYLNGEKMTYENQWRLECVKANPNENRIDINRNLDETSIRRIGQTTFIDGEQLGIWFIAKINGKEVTRVLLTIKIIDIKGSASYKLSINPNVINLRRQGGLIDLTAKTINFTITKVEEGIVSKINNLSTDLYILRVGGSPIYNLYDSIIYNAAGYTYQLIYKLNSVRYVLDQESIGFNIEGELGPKGEDGQDGISAEGYTVTLDNDAIILDDNVDSSVLSNLSETTISFYTEGVKKDKDDYSVNATISGDVSEYVELSNISDNNNYKYKLVYKSGVSEFSESGIYGKIVYEITYQSSGSNTVTINKTQSISVLNFSNGEGYKLIVSPNSFVNKNSIPQDTSLNISLLKLVSGEKPESISFGTSAIYKITYQLYKNGIPFELSENIQTTSTFNVNVIKVVDINSIVFRAYIKYNADWILIDSETVTVVNDGKNGTNGTNGTDGTNGSNGFNGAIVRFLGTWNDISDRGNRTFHCDNFSGINIGYIDVIFDGQNYQKCNHTYTSTSDDWQVNFATGNWTTSDNYQFIATDVLLALNGKIDFLDNQELRLFEYANQGNSNIIRGGARGGISESNGDIIFYAGSYIDTTDKQNPNTVTVEKSPFKVYENGDVVVNNLTAKGDFNGVFTSEITKLTGDASLDEFENLYYLNLREGYPTIIGPIGLNLFKLGNVVDITNLNHGNYTYDIFLPFYITVPNGGEEYNHDNSDEYDKYKHYLLCVNPENTSTFMGLDQLRKLVGKEITFVSNQLTGANSFNVVTAKMNTIDNYLCELPDSPDIDDQNWDFYHYPIGGNTAERYHYITFKCVNRMLPSIEDGGTVYNECIYWEVAPYRGNPITHFDPISNSN